MAIFDDLFDFVKPLTDAVKDVKGAIGDVVGKDGMDVIKAFTKGSATTNEAAKKAAEYARINRREDLMPVSQDYQAAKTEYGVQNYAVDPMAIERMWLQILTPFMTPNATAGKKGS